MDEVPMNCSPGEQAVAEEETDQLDDNGNVVEASSDLHGITFDDEGVQKCSQKVPRFMEGVPGVVYLQDVARAKSVQQKCRSFCGWKKDCFPGCHPVSMNLTNFKIIAKQRYGVSLKADGVRNMLLIDGENEVYFLDRNNHVFQVEGMHFPYVAGKEPYMGVHLTNTLLDGEMVVDKIDGQTIMARFLVYDIVHWMNEDTRKMDFDSRCHRIKSGIMEPRNRLAQERVFDEKAEPFSIRQKEFYPVKVRDQNGFANMAAKFLEEKSRNLSPHDVDGLIFQPYNMGYTSGRCDKVLKWKPPSQCTVDFLLSVEKSGEIPRTSGTLFVGGSHVPNPFGKLKWSNEYEQLNGKIIECRYDCPLGKWILERIRTDKTSPNHYTTAESVFRGIKQPLTQDKLMNFIDVSVPYFGGAKSKKGIQATHFENQPRAVDYTGNQR